MEPVASYQSAFDTPDQPFLTCWRHDEKGSLSSESFTRGRFGSLARRAAGVLSRAGLQPGDAVLHWFSANRVEDMAFRLGATLAGTVPVTVNWQADSAERVAYKAAATGARLLIVDGGVPAATLDAVRVRLPDLAVASAEGLEEAEAGGTADAALDEGAVRIVIFTSGTTALPKGVRLTYRNYRVSRATFETFLAVEPSTDLVLVAVNPLHHGNSTAITDWAVRRPGTRLHLVDRYSSRFWEILAGVATECAGAQIVAPVVSRHFDLLEGLRVEGRLPVEEGDLKKALRSVVLLAGSAPVGPTTVDRVREWTGRPPVVRFGSTETCLQVLGTPPGCEAEELMAAFRRGWDHVRDGLAQPGNYLGRPHPPWTEVRVVRSVVPGEAGYMEDCLEGEAGCLVARGGNVMAGYVGDDAATRAVMRDGWYTGLGDVCFRLGSDYYWMCRESGLLIRGGANYSCEQVSADLKAFACSRYGLGAEEFEVAVVGMRLASEHDDACCVVLDLLSEEAQMRREEMETTFVSESRAVVSKGCRPDRVVLARIPRNFKGAVVLSEMKSLFAG